MTCLYLDINVRKKTNSNKLYLLFIVEYEEDNKKGENVEE